MKALRNLLDKVQPNFEKGGKLEKFYAAYNAIETFLFVPNHTTHGGVHVRDAVDLKRTMFTVIIALLPTLVFGMWNTGYQHYQAFGMESSHIDNLLFGLIKIMPLIIVSYGAGLGVEILFAQMRGHAVNEGYLVTGMLIPLSLPVTTPLWMVALAAIFCVVLGKEVFGGTGMNFMNPALLARAFLFFAFPAYLSGEVWVDLTPEAGRALVDGYSGATALAVVDANYTATPSAWDMFMGFEKGSIGETSTLLILLGAAYLIFTGVGSWRIIVSVFLGGYLMGLFMNVLAPADAPTHIMHAPAYYHLIMGGFAFGAVYMATDPVSAAQTEAGKWIYGLLIGAFTVTLRVFNPAYPEGMMLSILFFNVFAPLIDHFVVQRNINKRLKRALQ